MYRAPPLEELSIGPTKSSGGTLRGEFVFDTLPDVLAYFDMHIFTHAHPSLVISDSASDGNGAHLQLSGLVLLHD